MADWQNWSGSVQGRPAAVYRPTALAELQAIIARAAKVRVVGAGHSFMPLCETDGSLLQLGQLDVPLEIAPNRKTVWAPAGWGLNRLTKTLWDEGLSLINQGDINPQALAGAIATGTHGTGAELGSMSTAARAFRFVGPSGEILTCSATEAPNLFAAQRLSLGMMGVVTQIEIDVLPAYYLEQKIRKVPLAQAVEEFDDLAATHRHAEFFVFPYSDEVILKTLHPTDEQRPARDPNPNEDDAFQICCDIGRALPFLIGPLQRFMMRAIGSHRKIGPAYSIFPSERAVRCSVAVAADNRHARQCATLFRRDDVDNPLPGVAHWKVGDAKLGSVAA